MACPFFTIGHSSRSVDEFVDLVMQVEIRLIVDVRTIPRSRTNPQYNSEEFARTLAKFKSATNTLLRWGACADGSVMCLRT